MDMSHQIIARIDALAAITAVPGEITRVFASPELKQAAEVITGWMQAAGCNVRCDAIGNVVGRYEGDRPGSPALVLGSHFDTVRNAGRWDGPLGVLTAIAVVDDLNASGRRLPFAIEVVAFSDEEGTRFASTLLGSRAMAGTFDTAVLAARDADGANMADAMRAYGLDPARIEEARRDPADLLGYVELHIEQGPVLERERVPVGIVTAISGAVRLRATVTGEAGHAGTVPMGYRRDALAGAAEMITTIERLSGVSNGTVATVGMIEARPGAPNVIPGEVVFTVDVRAADDAVRLALLGAIEAELQAIAAARQLDLALVETHASPTAACAGWLREQLRAAVAAQGWQVRELPSGAGHDAMALATITDIAMLFVRCRAGVSHNPLEHVDAADVEAGARVLASFVAAFEPGSTRG